MKSTQLRQTATAAVRPTSAPDRVRVVTMVRPVVNAPQGAAELADTGLVGRGMGHGS